jgi:hypothetical protein
MAGNDKVMVLGDNNCRQKTELTVTLVFIIMIYIEKSPQIMG